MCYQVSNGLFVKAWLDPWIPTLEAFKPLPLRHITEFPLSLKVSDLINCITNSWDIQKMQTLFQRDCIKEILKIPLLASTQRLDSLVWTKNQNEKFSVKTAYHLAAEIGSTL